MNLSKVKIVGFIPNFDRKGSYPSFGYKPIVIPSQAIVATTAVRVRSQVVLSPAQVIEQNITSRIKAEERLELSKAKSAFKKLVGSNYKAKVINN